MPKSTIVPIKKIIEALLNVDVPFPPQLLYRLSDISPDDLELIKASWLKISLRRRQALVEDIEQLGENDPLLCFDAFCRFALSDEDPQVRQLAVRTLWDYEDRDLADRFVQLMDKDSSSDVRAAAASGLGKFVYLGEIEEIPEKKLHRIVDHLLKICKGSDTSLVRRRALESLGYSCRDEVPPLIENAYYSGNDEWLSSALFAMGRSANENWKTLVQTMIDNDSPPVRLEAVRAAGELELKLCTDQIIERLNDPDEDVRSAAIWSLSQIGGEGVQELLEELCEDTDDEEELEYLEAALDNLTFTQDFGQFTLLDVADLDEDEPLDEDVIFDNDEDAPD
jgi:HEAT repeat protein